MECNTLLCIFKDHSHNVLAFGKEYKVEADALWTHSWTNVAQVTFKTSPIDGLHTCNQRRVHGGLDVGVRISDLTSLACALISNSTVQATHLTYKRLVFHYLAIVCRFPCGLCFWNFTWQWLLNFWHFSGKTIFQLKLFWDGCTFNAPIGFMNVLLCVLI